MGPYGRFWRQMSLLFGGLRRDSPRWRPVHSCANYLLLLVWRAGRLKDEDRRRCNVCIISLFAGRVGVKIYVPIRLAVGERTLFRVYFRTLLQIAVFLRSFVH